MERRRKTFEILLTEYLMTGIMVAALCRQNFILPHLFPETTSLQAEYKLDCCKQIKEIKENIPIDENNLPNHVETRTNYLLVFLNISFLLLLLLRFLLSFFQWFPSSLFLFLVIIIGIEEAAGRSVIRLGQ